MHFLKLRQFVKDNKDIRNIKNIKGNVKTFNNKEDITNKWK